MSQWEKLLSSVTKLSKDMRFKQLRIILEEFGYECSQPKKGSSHYIFRKKGCYPITIPRHEPIKKVYVLKVKEVIEKELKNEKN